MSQQQPQKQQKSSGAQQQQRKEIRIQALVKKVLSGDTIVLVHPAKPQQEKTVSFSNIQAPKLARKDDETEEPFAFEAREFVRRKCIGKLAEFVLEFTSDKGRDFGTLFLDESKENLTLSLLQEGLATTKKNVKDQDEYKPLKAAEEAAKNAKRGVHADEKVKAQNTRQLKKAVANAVYEQYKNKPTNMVVEAVLSGTTIRILTPTNDNILMHLTGVHSPDHVRIESKEEKKPSPPKNVVEAKDDKKDDKKKDDKKKDDKKKEQSGHKIPQPFAAEAKLFTETRLLQRDVTVIIEGVDGDAVIGTILKGNSANATTFQEELLSKGLSKIAPWNVQKSKFQPRLKMAEDDAKRQKLRYWQFETREPAQPKKSSLNESDKLEFTARVIEILNADSIRVRNEKTGEEERIALSSIRAQRLARRPPPKKRGEKKPADAPVDKSKKSADPAASAEEIQHEPYALEARELVRARLAGKHVTIRVDYRREMGAPKKDDKKNANKPQVEQPAAQQGAQETRRFCTVLSENKNVALELVQAGYATVIHHRFGEERSPFFSQLVAAENEAQAAKKGIHGSKKNFPVYHINDLSSKTLGQVQQYLKMFKDTKKKAAVEKLFSPTRMKLSLFKDAMVINFAVLGVGTPAAARGKDGQAKPFSKEALQFAIDSLLMRDVEIEVLEMDKTGSFAGQLFVNGQNFSEALLKQGLGFIVPKAAAKLKNQQGLQDIEREAKNSKKGVWGVENFFEKKKRDENKPQRKLIVKTPQDTPFTVRLTEIVNATSFYYQTAASAEALEKLEEAMAALGLDAQTAATEAKEGELVFAKFSVDGAWYRGKALKHSKEGKVKVQFIDFGNTEEVALADVRSAVPDAIKQVPAQAQLANLAFTYYADSQYQEALSFTREFADGRDIIAQFEFEDDNGKSVSLIDPVDKASLATLLVQNGLALVDKPYHISKNPLFKAVIDELLKELGAAKTDRVGTWENGDVEDEEDDE